MDSSDPLLKFFFNTREPLINYTMSLAYRLIHNQDEALKACLGLVKSDNAECESTCKPRRARSETAQQRHCASCKGHGHSLRSTLCRWPFQGLQRHGVINQRFPSYWQARYAAAFYRQLAVCVHLSLRPQQDFHRQSNR